MKFPLALALLLLSSLPGRAQDAAVQPGAALGDKPAPRLLELDRVLTQEGEAKTKGLLRPEQYQDFVVEFRAKLDAVMASTPPTPVNRGLHAQIIARLGAKERGQALAGLDQALKDDPKNPELLRAKAQIFYDQKNYPAAAEVARQAGPMALALLKMSEGRTAEGSAASGAAPSGGPQARNVNPVTADDSSKPYKLATKISVKPIEVPMTGQEPAAARQMHSTATGLWGGAADGLIIRGSGWISSADAINDNGFAAVGKVAAKIVGKGLVTAGGLMDAAPVAAEWTLDKDYRLLTGDLTVVADISGGAYALGKTAVVGFADDARVAAKDWGDLVTFKKPTAYQALKATAHTEAILANFLPFGIGAKGAGAAVEMAEVVGASAGRSALAKTILLGGRELGEGAALGAEERSIAKFTVDRIKITPRGVEAVEEHLARFEADSPNAAMIERLQKISRGELTATPQDLQFYAHELREKVLYRQAKIPNGQLGEYEVGSGAHSRALKEYGLTNNPDELYHSEADVAGEDAGILKKYGLNSK